MIEITEKDRKICESVKEHLLEEVRKIVDHVSCFKDKEMDTANVLAVIAMLYQDGLIAMRHAK